MGGHTLITGASGFVGSALARTIARAMAPGDRLTLVDRDIAPEFDRPGIVRWGGTLSDRALLAEAVGSGVDTVFHLATVPGRGAEEDFDAGKDSNLDATIALLETLRGVSPGCRLVAASSVAVYGTPVPGHVDDDTYPQPALSYAAHKLVSEILINDYTRRGYVDGLSLRLSGILARPPGSMVNLSSFFNDVIYAARDGKAFVMPISPDTHSWFMSRSCCVENLLHAAALDKARLPARRNWALPALRISMRDLVAALARRFGPEVVDRVRFEPRDDLDAIFNQPPLGAAMASELGFCADASVDALLEAALAP